MPNKNKEWSQNYSFFNTIPPVHYIKSKYAFYWYKNEKTTRLVADHIGVISDTVSYSFIFIPRDNDQHRSAKHRCTRDVKRYLVIFHQRIDNGVNDRVKQRLANSVYIFHGNMLTAGLTIASNECSLIGGRGLANYIADCRCAHRRTTAICITSDYSDVHSKRSSRSPSRISLLPIAEQSGLIIHSVSGDSASSAFFTSS